ncbi:cardiolipin synthetase 2 [Natranaerovirga pectinivora]|uniref:Cardiolipin synthase n=1 Tax=Natranaerovirga pectinivora TaxID=682400 RepID=A0A4V2V046_9FIRM|nr:cardiolipin synthase [Natranaerovirga pectinivora]TCT13991.1 cardiolipin synthetase 2 [Natranaerovirga pectinivora]
MLKIQRLDGEIITVGIGEFIVSSYRWIFSNILLINILLAILIVFFERRNPTSVWAWILILIFFPIGGFILYLLLGQDLRRKKLFKVKEIEDEVNRVIRRQEEKIYRNEYKAIDPLFQEFRDMIMFNLVSNSSMYTADNEIEIYNDGIKKFQALIDAIDNAKSFVHIQYYIFRDDELSVRLCETLCKKAREGIEVRLLYDGMGCIRVKKKFWKHLAKSGVKIAEFFPPFVPLVNLRVNFRNHRKIVIIDGYQGFVGGFNVGKEYIGKVKKFGYWRDTHLKIIGSAVDSLQMRFLLDWNYASRENLIRYEKYFPTKVLAGSNGIQIVSSGPDSKRQNVRNNYLKMIMKAKKSIYIQTPYLIPDDAILECLKIAALSGVDVRVMIPDKPDHPFVYWASISYIGELIDAGAKCYKYNNGFLHSKVVTIDGLVSSVGTANMDIRSFKLNFEVNAFIYNSKTTMELEKNFMEDVKNSTEITKYLYMQRSLIIKIKESISRLLSPVL